MNGYIDKKLTSHIWIICGVYALAGISWILISDHLLPFIASPEQIMQFQSWKGIGFVVATTLLLFVIIRKKNNSIRELFYKLREQMQHFQATFEQAAVGIVHMTPEEQWIRVNQKACDILGYTHREFQTLTLEDIVHPEDLEEGRAKDQRLINEMIDHYVMEKRYITKSGHSIPARLTKSAVRDPDGELEYIIAIIEDITVQKQAEQKLKRSLREKELLLAEIHHRVKNNLAVISGLMELQADCSDDQQICSVLQESMMRIKSMALIHESYYEGGKLAYVTIDSYLQELIQYIQEAYSTLEHVIQVELDAEPLKLNINQAMPCGLLLTELLIDCCCSSGNNQDRSVRINLCQTEEGRISLSVRSSSMSFASAAKKPSLAKTIVEALVSQLEATLDTNQCEEEREITVSFVRDESKKGSSSALLDGREADGTTSNGSLG